MKTKRIIISILLLCTYSLSFAQGLLPHSHDWQDGIGNEEHHHYLNQDKQAAQPTGCEDSNQTDEGDKNILDLILCFLTDLDNPDDDAKTEANNPTVNTQKVFQQIQLAAVILSFVPVAKPEIQIYIPRGKPLFQSVFTKYIPQRGPPSIS